MGNHGAPIRDVKQIAGWFQHDTERLMFAKRETN